MYSNAGCVIRGYDWWEVSCVILLNYQSMIVENSLRYTLVILESMIVGGSSRHTLALLENTIMREIMLWYFDYKKIL